jgi:hypothetical protein
MKQSTHHDYRFSCNQREKEMGQFLNVLVIDFGGDGQGADTGLSILK